VDHLCLSPDGKLLATSQPDGFHLWDLASGRVIHDLGPRDVPWPRFAFTHDGLTIATLHGRGIVRLWDTRMGKLIRVQQELSNTASIAFSPDGKFLASADAAGTSNSPPPTIRLREVATGNLVRTLKGLGVRDNDIAFSPDGRSIVLTARHYCEVFVIEVATGQIRHKFAGHPRQITCSAIAPNGRFIATGSDDATVLLWDAVGARSRQQPQAPLDAAELNRLWGELAKENAVAAYQAICKLRASPKHAAALFERHCQPVPRIEAKKLAELLRRLDSNQFAVREQASKELIALGEAAEPALRQALRDPSLELRRRVEQILDRPGGAESLRRIRMFEVLEHAADAESRRFLRGLADGAPGTRLTREAQDVLARLERLHR
jgi:hypothetical protein